MKGYIMPTVGDLKNSRFLTKEDAMPPVAVTVKSYEEMNVAMDNKPVSMKWVLWFNEMEKPMVLNNTNGKRIERITGTDDFDGWIGKRMELFNDEMVEFGGDLVGGIRARPIQQQQSPPQQQAPPPEDTRDFSEGNPDNNSIPF